MNDQERRAGLIREAVNDIAEQRDPPDVIEARLADACREAGLAPVTVDELDAAVFEEMSRIAARVEHERAAVAPLETLRRHRRAMGLPARGTQLRRP